MVADTPSQPPVLYGSSVGAIAVFMMLEFMDCSFMVFVVVVDFAVYSEVLQYWYLSSAGMKVSELRQFLEQLRGHAHYPDSCSQRGTSLTRFNSKFFSRNESPSNRGGSSLQPRQQLILTPHNNISTPRTPYLFFLAACVPLRLKQQT